MDHKKIKDEWLLFVVVGLAGVLAATWYRANAVAKGMDTGTANLVFVMVLVFTVVLFIALVKILEWLIPVIIRKIPRLRKRYEANRLKYQPEPVIEENEAITEQPKAGKPDWKELHEKEIQSKLSLFNDFTDLVLIPYVRDSGLAELKNYIELFAREVALPEEVQPVKTEKLSNKDLFHFGWNMAHYFGLPKQDSAPWLKKVFANLSELDEGYIKGKLHDYQTKKYIIPNIDDLPRYMEEKGLKEP